MSLGSFLFSAEADVPRPLSLLLHIAKEVAENDAKQVNPNTVDASRGFLALQCADVV